MKNNLIPKVIHYSWFGNKKLPEIATKCLKSWKKHCPDYVIIFWNESNFKFSDNEYLTNTYNLSLYSKFNNYARLHIINTHGGIYLDIDVEIIKPLDELLLNKAFIGFESENFINTGNGFGSIPNNPLITYILDAYDSMASKIKTVDFFKENSPTIETRLLTERGLKKKNMLQDVGYFKVLPTEYLCPSKISNGNYIITENTFSIHHKIGSWLSHKQKIKLFTYKILVIIFREKFLSHFNNKKSKI